MPEIVLRGGVTTEDPRLDRVPQFDPQSRNFQVRETLERIGARSPRSYTWPPNTTLDQLQEGACVGFSGTHRAGGDPTRHDGLDAAFARRIYKRAQQLDEWTGEDYEGTSVLAGCKALVEAGYASEYRWVGAGSGRVIDDVVDTLGYVGGIVFGLWWPESAFRPRPSGLLEVDTRRFAGGHAIHGFAVWLGATLKGERRKMDLVALQNSWGPNWGVRAYGQGGICFIRLEDLETLLLRQGEGAVLLEATPTIVQACPTCGQRLPK